MRESTLGSSWENAQNSGCLHAGGHLAGQTNSLDTPLGLAMLPILFSSLGVCGRKNILHLCVLLGTTSTCQGVCWNLLLLVFCCHLLDSRVLRAGEVDWC